MLPLTYTRQTSPTWGGGSCIERPGRFVPLIVSLLMTLALGLAGTARPVLARDEPCSTTETACELDAAARIRIVIKSIYVLDNATFLGSSDMTLNVIVRECHSDLCVDRGDPDLAHAKLEFRADDGDTLTPNRPVPLSDDTALETVGSRYGIPISPDYPYLLLLVPTESSFGGLNFDLGGSVWMRLTLGNNWEIGPHHVQLLNTGGLEGPQLDIEFEIQRVPLPDLIPGEPQVLDIPGSARKTVCFPVENDGELDAGPFDVSISLNDGASLKASAGGLAKGARGDVCTVVDVPAGGIRKVSGYVDEARGIREQNELNNLFSLAIASRVTPPVSGVGPGLTGTSDGEPSAKSVDLRVEQVAIRAKNAQTAGDCGPGQNTVSIAVRNAGSVAAHDVGIRLVVDDDDSYETKIALVDAGKQADATLSGVSLKKGTHALHVTLDPRGQITEMNEGDNLKTVNVNCRDE